MKIHIFGQALYLAGSKSSRAELMIIVTNQHPINAIACYLRRWKKKPLVSTLKTRGWRFEQTHLTANKKIDKLIVLLAIGFVWGFRLEIKPLESGFKTFSRTHVILIQVILIQGIWV